MAIAPITGDPRFFARSGPFGLAEIAAAAGGEAHGAPARFSGIAPLQTAGPQEVSFLDNRRYLEALAATRAGAVILHPDLAGRLPAGAAAILTREPYAAWARVAALFHPPPPHRPGVHPSAVIDSEAVVDVSAEIGPLAVVAARAEIGARARVGPGAVIGEGVVIGEDCRIGAGASLSHALLGARVVIHPGARIGQEGFGFAITAAGYLSVPQLGRVILEDDVDVGANCTIDRGSAQDTVIGAGSRLDNLAQIGHNVRLGRGCVIVAQVGLSGSVVLEDQVMMGGQSGVAGHVRIGRGARVAAQSGVTADLAAGAEVAGSPAQPAKQAFRQFALLRRLVERGDWRRMGGDNTG